MNRLNLALSSAALAGTIASTAQGQGNDHHNDFTFEVGVVALNTSASGAITVSGSGEMMVPRIHANSNHNSAIIGSGNGTLRARCIHSAGGIEFGNSTNVTGVVLENAGTVVHPFEAFEMPESGDLPADLGGLDLKGGSHVVSPGYYSDGIELRSNADVTLQPGIYYVDGVGFLARSGVVTGTDVTIVLMGGELDMSGNADVYLGPSDDGKYEGISILQHSDNTNPIVFRGGAGFYLGGSVLAPSAHVDIRGNSAMVGMEPFFGDLLVCDTADIGGNGAIRIGMWRLAGNLPIAPLWD